MLLVDPQFVAGMAGFMDGRVDAVERIALDHAGGDAHIVARAGRERMHRHIQPPARPVIAKRGRRDARDAQLRGLGEDVVKLGHLAIGAKHLLAQGNQTRAHTVEHRAKLTMGHARLVIIDQRVIKIAFGEAGRLLALEAHDLFERGQEGRGVFGGPCLGPDPLAKRGQPSKLTGKPRRNAGLAVVAARHKVDEACLYGGLRLGAGQPDLDPRIGAARVQNRFKRGHLIGALLGGTTRHHGFLIPAKPFRDMRQRLGLALIGDEFLKSCHFDPRIDCTTGVRARCWARMVSTQRTTAPN